MKQNTLTALIIEDEPLLLAAITKKMKKSGIEPLTAKTAEEAIEYLEKTVVLPDLIWLDYYLSGEMNGVDFMQQCHGNEIWRKIPVIVVSNTATQAKVKAMLDLGAIKYFLKAEYLLSDIIDFIKTYFKTSKQ